MSENTNDIPRRRGGQPGNLNHLKHGLYIEGRSIRNTTPIERAQINDLVHIIACTKDYINRLYEEGLKCKTIAEFNLTMHNISAAAMALTRLISIHNQFQSICLPSDFIVTKKTTVLNLVEHYKKKMSSVVDISELESISED
ncbi:MAG: hypothetical protein CVU42_11735 [Chloroflexi bacterium HGW-Chloroflexi-4]|nr:MAG: hypothetical protein CVU42_11735 [Chloroflexi bacterium HGW-Chloroflexi-4]